jgi:zinc transport system ATP-binding protein
MQIAGGPPVLEARAAGVVLGAATVLDAVDFCLRRGEFVALLGPNGSGKTTLVRALLGIVPVSRGTVELFGTPIERFSAWERIGYVPQRATAATGVPATVFEVVLSGRVARSRRPGGFRARDRDAAGQAMEAVGLAHLARRPVAMLSGGQQQRVLIARALATEPEVLVLDEAVSSVDVASQRSFSETLQSLEHAGLSVLAVAHALGVLEPLVTRAVVLEGGGVVYEGAPRPTDVALDHPHPHHPETPSARRERASFDRTVKRR